MPKIEERLKEIRRRAEFNYTISNLTVIELLDLIDRQREALEIDEGLIEVGISAAPTTPRDTIIDIIEAVVDAIQKRAASNGGER